MTLADLPLYLFASGALLGAVLMLVARHPMRVAIALIGTMLSLAGVFAALGVHVIAVFQVLIYVGAVMVFMVYVIMLLDVGDPAFSRKYGRLLLPGIAASAVLALALGYAAMHLRGAAVTGPAGPVGPEAGDAFDLQPFSATFLEEYWLHFELTSVLLLVAVVAAVAVIRGGRSNDG